MDSDPTTAKVFSEINRITTPEISTGIVSEKSGETKGGTGDSFQRGLASPTHSHGMLPPKTGIEMALRKTLGLYIRQGRDESVSED